MAVPTNPNASREPANAARIRQPGVPMIVAMRAVGTSHCPRADTISWESRSRYHDAYAFPPRRSGRQAVPVADRRRPPPPLAGRPPDFSVTPSLTSLCVYCGSAVGRSMRYRAAAERLGRDLAANDVRLIYGG